MNSARRRNFTAKTLQIIVCVLLRGDASALCAHSWSPCGREIHESGAGPACSADTYVSSKILRKLKNFATREPTILMGVAPACQRTRAYATFGASRSVAGKVQLTRMEFGLLPKFSTPVQKPVEIGVLRRTDLKNRAVYGCFLMAKAFRARFEATLGVPPIIQTQSAIGR